MRSALILAAVLLLPTAARAQSAFAGIVKDTTGAVLPGVTVEAASPVLIEQVRTVTSDANGAYRIENLRPGTYTLTFSLPGFSSVKREGIELQANFTATINAEMKVGAVEETVTVAGESPVVDVQTNTKAQVLPREVLDAVPSAHTIQSLGQLVTGVTLTAPDVGGSQAMQQTYFTVHGLGAAQTSLLIDGMIINGLQGDGAIQTYFNEGTNQEMVYQTGGGNVDSPTGGVKINMIGKEGGNRFTGSLFEGYETSKAQASNMTDFLSSHGVTSLDRIGTYNDFDATQGGPIMKDKLWFFGSARFFIVNKPIASTVVSDGTVAGALSCFKNVGSCPQGVDQQHQYSGLARFTWQVNAKNKLAGYVDRIHKIRGAAMSPGNDQTTAGVVWTSPNYTTGMVKWTSTLTSKLLLEGGYSQNVERYNNLYEPTVPLPPYRSADFYKYATHIDDTDGLVYAGSTGAENGQYPDRYNLQGSASYITGSHSVKVGIQDSWGLFRHWYYANADLWQHYTIQNGVLSPFTVQLLDTPLNSAERLNANLGIYAQDIWTLKRLTLTIGGRYEHVSEAVVGQPTQTGTYANVPAFGDIQMPIWNTFSPRVGAVWDARGDGKTAVRFGYNRFESAATTTMASLFNPSAFLSVTVGWTDLNKDDIAQGPYGCTYLTAGCEINWQAVPATFGQASLSQFDPNLKRPYVDQYNVGATQEVLTGVSVSAEWFHNAQHQVFIQNNILRPGTYSNGTVTNSSYRPVTVFSPIDGTPLTIYDPINATVGRAQSFIVTNDPNLTQVYDALEFNFNARLPHGARLFGGTATDRAVANTCDAAATNPNFLVTIGGTNYCDQSNSGIPWRTQFKLAGTYPLPWWGVIVSGSYQGLPGYQIGTQALTAGGAGAPNFTQISGAGSTWSITSSTKYTVCPGNSASQGCTVGALVAPGLITAAAVPLYAPGTELMPRLNQVDFSVAKRVKAGRFSFDPKLDIFNAFNSSAYFTTKTNSFTATATPGVSAGAYLWPGSILQGRLLRIGVVMNW
ncbi:MAG TPA: carboxypeptidase regulatory-like domain-containing protein [Vicinamibacterales bacterium]|nr:carboxypeptidase regulatory-like domain-containing protein [Vicinamibacterales bacterium]